MFISLNSTEIFYCRLCGSENIETVFSFGYIPIANDLVKVGENRQSLESPLEVVRCENCFAVQLKHTVDPNVLFKNYLYSTPSNLNNYFKLYASDVSTFLNLKSGEGVVEIGGNNGMLCSHFKKLGHDAINVDPGLEVCNLSLNKGVKTYHSFFNKQIAKKIRGEYTGKVQLIVGNNVLAHCQLDPIMEGILELLDDDGTLVMQNCYLPKTLDSKDLGQIYAEHLFLHLLTPLETYFAQYDLNLYHVTFDDMQLGSFRAFIGKRKDEQSIKDAIIRERPYLQKSYYKKFWREVNEWKYKIFNLLEDLTYSNINDIAIYGTPAKLALILKFIGFDKFKYAIDDSHLKINKLVPGTNIKIKSSDYFKKNPTKYCFLGAYNFKEDIIRKNPQYWGIWIDPLSLQLY